MFNSFKYIPHLVKFRFVENSFPASTNSPSIFIFEAKFDKIENPKTMTYPYPTSVKTLPRSFRYLGHLVDLMMVAASKRYIVGKKRDLLML